jgi:AAA+ ATPase superfamily predicted ATPase
VASGATGHNAIAQQAGIPTGNLRRRLDRLEDLGYIAPASPLAAGGAEDRAVYELSEPFFRFWFRYVARNRARLELGRVDEVLAEIVADLDPFMGRTFEDCCRTWLGRYADAATAAAAEAIGRWWSRDGRTEIDGVGTRTAGRGRPARGLRPRRLHRRDAGTRAGGRRPARHRRRPLPLTVLSA